MGFYPKFCLPHFSGVRHPERSKKSLTELLRCLTSLDILYLQECPGTPKLYESGIRYVRDRPEEEDWQTIPSLLERGTGDCKSVVAYRVAELNVAGIKAFAQFRWADRIGRDGKKHATFHIEVQHPDGSIEDPSEILGMKKRKTFA